jgi:hypothetical protein
MKDWTYQEALSEMYWWRYGKEVSNMYDESTKQSMREAVERNWKPTEREMKEASLMHTTIRNEIKTSGGDGDVPPSIAKLYAGVYDDALRPPDRSSCYQNDLVKSHLNQNERAAMEMQRRKYWR